MGSIQNHSLGTDNIAQGSYYDIAWSNSAFFDCRVIAKNIENTSFLKRL